MIYLSRFSFPSREADEGFFTDNPKTKMTVFQSFYPFGLFRDREFPRFTFSDITVFYGGNGSGKSTVLNVISEKLGLERTNPYNRTDFFDDYVDLCDSFAERKIPGGSAIITSDDVFDRVMETRRLNDGIDSRRGVLVDEYVEEQSKMYAGVSNTLSGIDDYERWKAASEKRNKTRSAFLRKNLISNIPERSNGESALAYFVEKIADSRLYLLDEPENSLSPANQRLLAGFIEDAVRNRGCQFVIATHSPFLLSLRFSKVWNLDAVPAAETLWTDLENVRVYRDFFRENEPLFKD